jgi:hypothetical protein
MMLYLISQRQLLPGIVVMGSFILFVLWMVGMIVISIELWGPTGSVNGNCNLYVTEAASQGPNINTLAYLEQHSICEYLCEFGCVRMGEGNREMEANMLTCRPELDSRVGISAGGMRLPVLDDDYGISSLRRRLIGLRNLLSSSNETKT